MRILHVSDCYLPQVGGIELHVHDLAARQRAYGHAVRVATVTPGPQAAGGSVIRLPGLNGLPHPRGLVELSHMIGSGGFDIVHVHSSLLSPLAWSAARAASRSSTPAVLTMHSMLPSGRTARALREILPKLTSKVVWTAVSSVAATSLRGVFPDHQVSVLPNGIDPEGWANDGTRTSARPLTIVSVMRTARRKRPLQYLDILEAIRRDVPPCIELRAVLVGTGPLDGAITRRLAGSGMDRWVSQPGRLSRAEIRDVLHRSDLYLAPATLESFGIAALEARSAGLPVIGMAGGGITDFIEHGTEGFLVDSDNAMAAHAADLLSDQLRLRRMQRHNRQYEPSFSWPHVLELHEDIYAAAGGRGRRPLPGFASAPDDGDTDRAATDGLTADRKVSH
jgi:glycosyltransferase involved in cell wall biosynthesis